MSAREQAAAILDDLREIDNVDIPPDVDADDLEEAIDSGAPRPVNLRRVLRQFTDEA